MNFQYETVLRDCDWQCDASVWRGWQAKGIQNRLISLAIPGSFESRSRAFAIHASRAREDAYFEYPSLANLLFFCGETCMQKAFEETVYNAASSFATEARTAKRSKWDSSETPKEVLEQSSEIKRHCKPSLQKPYHRENMC